MAAADEPPRRASGLTWLAAGLAVAGTFYYLFGRDTGTGAPAATARPAAHGEPAMMNNMSRLTLACTSEGTRILIAPFSRSFLQAGTYRCRPPVPPAPITLGPGGSVDFELGDGGRVTVRQPSAYAS